MAPNPHTELRNRLLVALSQIPGVRVWRQACANVETEHGRVCTGVPGCADITGITGDGRRLEVEVKTGSGRQRTEQTRFEAMIRARHGIYVVARSVEQGVREVTEALS